MAVTRRSSPSVAPATLRTRLAVAIAVASLLGVLIGVGVHLAGSRSTPSLDLPPFHGQGAWGPRERRAPTFSLRDQHGQVVSLAAQRGQPLAIAFLSGRGGRSSEVEGLALARAREMLGHAPKPILDVVSLDPAGDTPVRIHAAAARWGLSGSYHWLTGPRAALATVWRRYGVSTLTGEGAGAPLYLVDRQGFERAGYLFPFPPGVLARDFRTLESQLNRR